MPRINQPCLLFALFLALLMTGCHKETPPAAEESHAAPVKVASPQMASYAEWTEVIGVTQPLPSHSARITAAVEGRVLKILDDGKSPQLQEGLEVRIGQTLVQLDDRITQANLRSAQAALDETEEQIKQAGFAVETAQLKIDRLVVLQKQSVSAPMPLFAKTEMDEAKLAMQEALSKQKGSLAKKETAKAQVSALAQQLSFYSLQSPIAGRLGLIQVVPGQTLAVGTTVAEVLDLKEIDVLCNVPPYIAAKLSLNKPAKIDAGGEHEEAKAPAGKVVFIALQGHPDTGNIAVKVRFPNPELHLTANTMVHVQIETQPVKNRLTVPEAAILEDQDPPGVVLVREVSEEKDGKQVKIKKAWKLQAEVGTRDHEHHVVELLELKDPKDKKAVPTKDTVFIIEGAHGLEDGDEVKIEEEKPEEKKDEKHDDKKDEKPGEKKAESHDEKKDEKKEHK